MVLSIVIPEEKTTRCLKGLKKAAPHAYVHTAYLFVSQGKIRGVAFHPGACGYEEAQCEMTPDEFAQLNFELLGNTG